MTQAPEKAPSRVWRAAASLGTFVITTALVLWAMDGLHRPQDPRLDAKIDTFLENKDDYTVLFFGSSTFYRGIIPERFDAELSKRGFDSNSLNLGLPAMRAHETNEFLRRMLENRPQRLRWVVVELNEWLQPRRNFFAQREIAWHDFPETLSVIRTHWMTRGPLSARLRQARQDAMMFGARTTALGVGAERVKKTFNNATQPRPAENPYDLAVARWRGFSPYSDELIPDRNDSGRRRFLRNLARYERDVAALPQRNARQVRIGRYNRAALQRQIDFVEESGYEIVHVISPIATARPILHRIVDAGTVPHPLAFDSPVEYPELYEMESRFNGGHLSSSGAELFTSSLAERFAELLAED